MKKTKLLASLFAVIFTCTLAVLFPLQQTSAYEQGLTPSSSSKAIAAKTQIQCTLFNMPISFIKNVGQKDQRVQFYEHGHGHTTYFTRDGIYITLLPETDEERYDFIRLFPRGAGNNFVIEAETKQQGTVNYFKGNNPEKWKRHIPAYGSVVYRGIYPGIDMKFYGNNRQLEYDILVIPGADLSQVRLSYEGINGLIITPDGNLEILLHSGKMIQRKPRAYQEVNGKRIGIEGTFVIHPEETIQKGTKRLTYGFEIASYDKRHPLIIDPVLDYSTYLGGTNDDYCNDMALDGSGNIYITGYTISSDFPTLNQIQSDQDGRDAFVTKIDPLQSGAASLIYSTYLGGNSVDEGRGIAVDDIGNIYVTGMTTSVDFPTLNQFQNDQAGSDVFVTKLNAPGDRFVYSTYLGGNAIDEGHDIAVDGSGNIYVTGITSSIDFPTLNQFQNNQAGSDAFVTKIDPSQSGVASLIYSTYLGGNSIDEGYSIIINSSGNACITGLTDSSDFPILNQFQNDQVGRDAFVTEIDPSQSGVASLIYSTYLGGNSIDEGHGIAVDNTGNAYVTGLTDSIDFPVINQFQNDQVGRDAFVTKIDPSQSGVASLIYSTYLGGNSIDEGHGIAVDNTGNAYVTGLTDSFDFPTLNQFQNDQLSRDAFVTKIDASESGTASLIYSTYLGGGSQDEGRSISVNTSGNAHIAGNTFSNNFPVTSTAYQDTPASLALEIFVTKFTEVTPPNGDSGDTGDGCFISTTSE